ncbi:hypothetical protein SUGI_0300110 [Cryptomeria japonica]|uniref:mitogen-activated protein kinase kinase kinase 20 n=1 Tax=Cryptomeria japonica TaxID=3369 RepID=UPI002408B09C|nr:mitogen-activated protein kinase kinase kinase 20 [Cryptomeria japonica]GLJ17288.1 hypothetical protein SUGI_0300110 [Cryptomeria japonica]
MGDCCSETPMDWLRGNVVGAGAFGTVSLAMNKANGQLFAVKTIEVKDEARRDLLGLENEAQILQELDSPWIVRSLGYDFTEENGVRMGNLFMEYMAGGSVADIIKKFGGRLDESVIRTYTRGILYGIDYLHKEGFVHCDIKGKNVLLGSSGVVKLADFGSAKRITDGSGVQLRGTPLWMAPEVVRQESQGKASDIWSLGCTVVEMATGSPPWSNISHPLVAMYKIGCSNELPELPQSLSPEGLDFLDKCFRRDPEQRWNSTQLLNHPFVTEWFQDQGHQKHVGAQSPPTTLDFNRVWDSESSTASSELSQTVPLLPLQMEMNTTKVKSQECEKILRPSPLGPSHWIHEFRENDVSQSPPLPIPHGQWIVVKSPKHNPPMLDDAPFTDFIGGPFTNKTSTLDSHVKSEPDCGKDIGSQELSFPQFHATQLQSAIQSIEGDSSLITQSQHCSHALSECHACVKCPMVHSDLIFSDTHQGKVLTKAMINYDYLGNLWVQTKEWIYQHFHELKKFHFKLPLPLPPIYKSIRMKVAGTLACNSDVKNSRSIGIFKR